jgi:hypothetical protein
MIQRMTTTTSATAPAGCLPRLCIVSPPVSHEGVDRGLLESLTESASFPRVGRVFTGKYSISSRPTRPLPFASRSGSTTLVSRDSSDLLVPVCLGRSVHTRRNERSQLRIWLHNERAHFHIGRMQGRKACFDATAIASQQAARPGRTTAQTELLGYGCGTNQSARQHLCSLGQGCVLE